MEATGSEWMRLERSINGSLDSALNISCFESEIICVEATGLE